MGLIGGSVAAGLSESGFAEAIWGIDSDARACDLALEKGWLEGCVPSVAEAGQIDLWVIATPPKQVGAVLGELAPLASPDCAITDTSSVKGAIQATVPKKLIPQFVGGHPMAGFERSGIENASENLFDDAHWILTPNNATQPLCLKRVRQMVFALDAIPIEMTVEEHDRHVALVSHLPHLLANALLQTSTSIPHPEATGGSWQDLTRVGGAEAELWHEILSLNEHAIEEMSEEFLTHLKRMLQQVKGQDRTALVKSIQQAHRAKARTHKHTQVKYQECT
ncbi:MAG: prephenate dehydrogenase/arogenate dehydrogenase family protein [Armatimonadetes bacterium]|nr:prephenate dehydrogenase/arogenate dehydrogenase family protein [Armatimonadota bacterium]